MSVIGIPATCTCGNILPELRLCPDHHRYFRAGRELASVTKVIRETWPIKPDFSSAPPGVLEHARERGVDADVLFSAYVNGALTKIPRGTWHDARDLFYKLKDWWDARPACEKPGRAQVMLADDEIAGTCDLITADSQIIDIKATYNLEATYPIQVGAYADLCGNKYAALAILHVTARFATPRLIELDRQQSVEDWRLIRAMWRMMKRRTQ